VTTIATGTATEQTVVASAQRVVISVTSRGTTETVVQIGVPETSADYGVLIPTPSEPTLDPSPIPQWTLDELDAWTRPTIVKHYYTESGGDSGSGCSCLPISGSSGGDSVGSGTAQGVVTASQPTNIGPVTATVVTASNADALNAWLAANGFVIPAERAALVASYVQPGRYFIAVKRNDATADGSPSSIGLHYTLTGDHRLLSLAFARLGAAPTVAFTVFLFAAQPLAPSPPFAALTLSDLDWKLDDYQAAIQTAVKARAGRAFVLESAQADSTVGADLPTNVVDFTGAFLRMSTVLAADDLTQDAMFFGDPVSPFEGKLDVYVEGYPPKAASFGALGLLALGLGLRRRGRVQGKGLAIRTV
jgi:hypothetical protein